MSADLGLLQCLVNQQVGAEKMAGDLQEKGFWNARSNDPYVLHLVVKNLPSINPALLVPVRSLGTDQASPKLRLGSTTHCGRIFALDLPGCLNLGTGHRPFIGGRAASQSGCLAPAVTAPSN